MDFRGLEKIANGFTRMKAATREYFQTYYQSIKPPKRLLNPDDRENLEKLYQKSQTIKNR